MLWELAYNSWSTLVSRICRFIIACFTCFRAHTTETHKYIKVCVADTLSDQQHREIDVFGSSVILKKCGFDLCVASLCISVVWRLLFPSLKPWRHPAETPSHLCNGSGGQVQRSQESRLVSRHFLSGKKTEITILLRFDSLTCKKIHSMRKPATFSDNHFPCCNCRFQYCRLEILQIS